MKTLVCWHDHGAYWFSRYLRKQFRHVFIVVLDRRDYWIGIDGMDGLPQTNVVAGVDFDLLGHYREQGFTVLEINADRAPRPLFLMAGTCTGLVKVMLGVRAPWIFTPYQLHRYLKRRIQHG